MGDPLEIRVRGYELTIRKSEASKIVIEDIHEAHNCPRRNKEFKKIDHSRKGEQTIRKKNTPPKTKLLFALAGNQNSGKTTLFNKLTGSNQHVGNFPGVTVDKKDGILKGNQNITITDLPGIYSLSPYSSEEIVTRDFILHEKPDGIINIVDAANIERNLFLTMQLLELNIPMVIALNMMDEVAESGGSIDINGLEAELGVPVIPISAAKNQGIEELVDMRFGFIEKLCSEFVSKPEESIGHKLSVNADKILTGKYTAIPAFLFILGIIFYLTFGPIGSTLSNIMNAGIDKLTSFTDSALTAYGLNPVVHSLIIDGIFAGVGSVMSFLPVIVVLFFFLSILEDSGYMARVAFVMDKILRKAGLSGRSFVPMIIGFGCSVPAIMASRTLPSERDRKMTILLIPFMSCSAKLPIYALFTAAFFKENQVIVILCMYLIGMFIGVIMAFILKYFVFKGEAVPFVMELPNYRMPDAGNVYRLIYTKAKDFITRAFTIIFWATIVIWFLQTFDMRLNLVTNSADSLLAMLGSLLTPIFQPLGLNDWRISTAFITGFMAKESVVSTLSVLAGNISEMFTPITAFVFMVFCLLYTPCVAAIATVRRELGRKYAVMVVLMQCSIAWLAAFAIYRLVNIVF